MSKTNLHPAGVALLSALNELFVPDWILTPGSEFYCYDLVLPAVDGEPFLYHRAIKPEHINGEPFRTALQFADEVCERYGRYMLLRADDAQF